jgi:hypothetical protein
MHATFKPVRASYTAMDPVKLRYFQVEEIARAFKLPDDVGISLRDYVKTCEELAD